jgi:hypothetical protein
MRDRDSSQVGLLPGSMMGSNDGEIELTLTQLSITSKGLITAIVEVQLKYKLKFS